MDYKIITDAKQKEFEEAYAIYKESFPAGELESKSDIKTMLGKNSQPEEYPTCFWIVATNGLEVTGLATMQYLPSLAAAFLGYLVVKKKHREHGLGSTLAIHALKTIKNIHLKLSTKAFLGIFSEIDFLKGKSAIRQKRLMFWNRLGMRPLEVAWRYPQLTSGTKASGVYLAFWPSSEEFVAFSKEQMHNIVDIIYENVYNRRESDVELDLVRSSIAHGPRFITFRTL